MTGRELVIDAINFNNPAHVPIWFFNRDHHRGDIMYYVLNIERDGISEWGYKWEKLDDGTMGQPTNPVIPSWEDFSRALSATGGPPPGVTPPPILTPQEEEQLSKAMQNLVDNMSNLFPGPNMTILPREFYEKMIDELMKGGEAEACTNK